MGTNTPMTAKQLVQQHNRDHAGRYAEKTRSEVDGFEPPSRTAHPDLVYDDPTTWTPEFAQEVVDRAAGIHDRWRASRMDPETGAAEPFVVEQVWDFGVEVDDEERLLLAGVRTASSFTTSCDVANTRFEAVPETWQWKLMQHTAADLAGQDHPLPDGVADAPEPTSQQEAMAELVAAFEHDGGIIERPASGGVFWFAGHDLEDEFHPTGGWGHTRAGGRRRFLLGNEVLFAEGGNHEVFYPNPAAGGDYMIDIDYARGEIEAVTQDGGLAVRRDGQPSRLDAGRALWPRDRVDGPVEVRATGTATYRHPAQAPEGADGWHVTATGGDATIVATQVGWDEQKAGWMAAARTEADTRRAAILEQSEVRRRAYVDQHRGRLRMLPDWLKAQLR